ncbi:MAG: mevalonate kinase [Tenericutes bacterium ADurb.Bin239]|jgi:mevalonate kinase|nr:MAG: mevalonate kinase [Tenericutes bacterium ADurb.Bin239]
MDGYGLAKIILIGEHSVVYGHPAIAIPFYSLRSEVVLTPHTEFVLETKYYTGPLDKAVFELRGLVALISELKKEFKTLTPVIIGIRSSLPERSGMGSSASVAKAIIDAFNNHFSLGLTAFEYFELLKISENIYHTNASGIDASTIIYEKPIIYQKPHIKALNFNIDGYLAVFYSNTNSATKDAVEHVNKHPHRDIHINALGSLTANAKWALEHNDLKLLATMFNAAHTHLQALGISTPTLELLRVQLFSAGAIGVKITGGGMGGCLIALFDSETIATRAQKQLAEYPSWLIDLRKIT